jgi:hypothetical protein
MVNVDMNKIAEVAVKAWRRYSTWQRISIDTNNHGRLVNVIPNLVLKSVSPHSVAMFAYLILLRTCSHLPRFELSLPIPDLMP